MKPIVIVGGGLAALGVAASLSKAGVPFCIVEREQELGGRFTSLRGDGWVADMACPFFDVAWGGLRALLREAGLLEEQNVLEDRIAEVRHAEVLAARFHLNLASLRPGMAALFDEWGKEVEHLHGVDVDALHWNDAKRFFELRDAGTGKALRHPSSKQVLEASAVVLAIPGPEAVRIASASRIARGLAVKLGTLKTEPAAFAAIRIKRVDPGFAFTWLPESGELEWVSFENRKAPGRAPEGESLLAVRVRPAFARRLGTLEEETAWREAFTAVRAILPELPDHAIGGRLQFFLHGRPAEGSTVAIPDSGVPTEPEGLPFALAGDYTAGEDAEAIVRSGIRAAGQVLRRLGW